MFMEVNGYYRNEVTGAVSDRPVIMNALADISSREGVLMLRMVNVAMNILEKLNRVRLKKKRMYV